MNRLISIVALALVATVSSLFGQAPMRLSVFTAEQAENGRKELPTNSFGACTDCHGATLAGRTGDAGELPPFSSLPENYQALISGNNGRVPDLVGSSFRRRWSGRSTKALTTEFLERFGGLSETTRLNLVAYLLQANGASPGAQPLTMATDVDIRTLFPVVQSE